LKRSPRWECRRRRTVQVHHNEAKFSVQNIEYKSAGAIDFLMATAADLLLFEL